MTERALILVVDDDDGVRDSLRSLLEISGYRVQTYASAEEYLATPEPGAKCLIADIRMHGMNGLEFQDALIQRNMSLPLIFVTGHGDVTMAVRALKRGAMEFLEKPFHTAHILDAVARAVEISRHAGEKRTDQTWALQQMALLSPREKCVFDELVSGHSGKTAAFVLGISPRTIEIHRSNIRRKLKVRSLAEMTRIACAVPGGHAA